MKALVYEGMKNIQIKEVEDARLRKADDIIVRVTSAAICGSDLHLYHGMIPNMPKVPNLRSRWQPGQSESVEPLY